MRLRSMFVVAAAVLACAAASVNAQTIGVVGAGSSALYLELGQASATSGTASNCHWTDSAKRFTLTDSRFAGVTDTGNAWITWSPGTGTCAAPVAPFNVNIGMSTDSTVGNRCFFAVMPGAPPAGGSGCIFTTSITTSAGAGTGANTLAPLPTNDTQLPQSIINLITTGTFTHVNSAFTDIRPEDGKFATFRALTACGSAVVGGSQYLGLGYQTGTPGKGTSIAGSALNHAGGGSFNVIDFNVFGNDPVTATAVRSFNVLQVGAAPIVVFVNPSNTAGLGSLAVSNVDRAVLSGYLDGSLGRVADMNLQTGVAGGAATFVYVRESLSGTYNTMEYSIPNSMSNRSSQDVGVASVNATNNGLAVPVLNCAGNVVVPNGTVGAGSPQNPLEDQGTHGGITGAGQPGRFRAIGTGNLVAAVLAQSDGLGYAFWSAANFKNTTAANAKYLTVDGIDPIQETWSDGLVPTTNNGLLGDVSLAHVKDGSYPIWSVLRVVCDPAVSCTALGNLNTAAQNLLSPFQPDFVPGSQLFVRHAHFAPPGISFNAGNVPSNSPEAGGDVAGLVYTVQADADYTADAGDAGGFTSRRQ
jgi:hypothetical protein